MKSPVVGIDVGKYELVIYLNGSYYTVSNELSTIKQWFRKHATALKEIGFPRSWKTISMYRAR